MSLGTFGCAAAANTLNQVYEVANDALMKRTMRRPLPTGRVSRRHALLFAGAAGAAGVAVLYYKARRCARPPPCSAVLLYSAGRLCRSSVEHPVQRGRALGRLKGENRLLPVLVLRPSADCKTWEEAASACCSCISQALVGWHEQQRHWAAVHVPRSPPHSLRVATAGRACTGLTRFPRSQAPGTVHE